MTWARNTTYALAVAGAAWQVWEVFAIALLLLMVDDRWGVLE